MVATPTSLNCGEDFTVKIEVSNIGKSDEDEVTIQIFNDDLEIDTRVPNIGLDEGDSTVKTFDLTMPNQAEVGSKAFTVITYYDYNEESTRDVFAVDLESCEQNSGSTDSGSTDSGTTGTTDTTPPATTSGTTTAQTITGGAATQVTTTSDDDGGLRASSIYIVLLILAIVIVIAVGAVLIVKMVVVK